jgi:uncharacterized protein (TIGR02118 family)
MVKLIFCVHRLPSLSRAEFARYWREQHAPLVQRYAATLRIRRYVQCHSVDNPLNEMLRESRGGPEPYDGVAELWWDSLQDLEAALGAADAQQAGLALLEDERRFVDLSRSPIWLTEELPVIG